MFNHGYFVCFLIDMPSLPCYDYEFVSFKLYDKTVVELEGLVDHGHGPCQNAKKSSDL